MRNVNAKPENLEKALETGVQGEIWAVNLLKFKPGEDARIAYQEYTKAAVTGNDAKAELVFEGALLVDVIENADWDYVVIAKWPDVQEFVRVQRTPEYQAALVYRDRALARAELLLVTPSDFIMSLFKQ